MGAIGRGCVKNLCSAFCGRSPYSAPIEMSVLRAALISLSASKSLRSFAEKTWAGQRLSRRFVAGTEIPDALQAARAMNRLGLSDSVDNLSENVTNIAETRDSAHLYHQIADHVIPPAHDANATLKLKH